MTPAELEQHVLDHLGSARPLQRTFAQILDALPDPRHGKHRRWDRPLDRALQRLRKQGKIEYRGPVLGWVLRGALEFPA